MSRTVRTGTRVHAGRPPGVPPAMHTAPPFRHFVHRLERDDRLDRVASALDPAAEAVGSGRTGAALRGDWLGHALHPLLTDLPLGCWMAGGLLDLVGGRRSRPAAQRLIGLGLATAPATAAAGLAEHRTTTEPRVRRVTAAHAAGNTVVALAYLASWRHRRRGDHVRGVAYGLAGGTLAWVTGYLGGHLSFARRTGTGTRGGLDEPTLDDRTGSTGSEMSRDRPSTPAEAIREVAERIEGPVFDARETTSGTAPR